MANLKREWFGPRLWIILHSLAERSGSVTDPVSKLDEELAWLTLLTAIPGIMPCDLCRVHYREWYVTNLPTPLKKRLGLERRDYIRKWLCNLHNAVNKRNENGIVFTSEDCIQTYSSKTIGTEISEIYEMFSLGLNSQKVIPECIDKWKAAVVRLRRMYSI